MDLLHEEAFFFSSPRTFSCAYSYEIERQILAFCFTNLNTIVIGSYPSCFYGCSLYFSFLTFLVIYVTLEMHKICDITFMCCTTAKREQRRLNLWINRFGIFYLLRPRLKPRTPLCRFTCENGMGCDFAKKKKKIVLSLNS